MYRKHSLLFLLALLSLAIVACGSDQTEEETNTEGDGDGITVTVEGEDGDKQSINIDIDENDLNGIQNGIADALQEASDALRNNSNGEEVEVMGFRDLKEIMPGRLLGMERTKHTGEKTSAMGFAISQAEAEYEDGAQNLEVQVVDAGQFGMMKMGVAAWATMEIDRESDTGYERTIEIDGHKAYEKWDAHSGRAELILLYKDRYIITLKGDGLDEDDMRKALRRIDYDDLD